MDGDEAPPEGVGAGAVAAPQRGYVRFSATLAREVCRRTAAGDRQADICAEPGMPSVATLWRWSRQRADFARIYGRARALGGRGVNGRPPSFCPVAANEIVARVSEGEMLAAICADAHLPSLSTVYRWQGAQPEFAEALRVAREALAERFSAAGWKMAMEATPETAFLTQVRLKQLRWMTAVLGPRTHGKLKATEPPAPPEVTSVCYRHFEIEVHPETGQRRVIAWRPDPDTMKPVLEPSGPWLDPVDPVQKAKDVQALIDARKAREAPNPPDDPEGWC
jgi:hypothetical protein